MNRIQKTMLAIASAAIIIIWITSRLPVAFQDIEKGPLNRLYSTEFAGPEGVSENSRIIAELHKSVEVLDQQVDEVLEQAKHSVENARFIPVVITAYNPVSNQADSTPEITASNKRVKAGMIALSRDLEEEFGFEFGDTVIIEGFGSFNFEDRMNKRWTKRVDIFMFCEEEAKEFGVQHSVLTTRNTRA